MNLLYWLAADCCWAAATLIWRGWVVTLLTFVVDACCSRLGGRIIGIFPPIYGCCENDVFAVRFVILVKPVLVVAILTLSYGVPVAMIDAWLAAGDICRSRVVTPVLEDIEDDVGLRVAMKINFFCYSRSRLDFDGIRCLLRLEKMRKKEMKRKWLWLTLIVNRPSMSNNKDEYKEIRNKIDKIRFIQLNMVYSFFSFNFL